MQTTFPRLLLDHAARRPAEPALREKAYGIWQTLSWAQLARLVRELACGLHAAGLQRGEHLVVIGENRPRMYAATLAAQSLGAIAVPLIEDNLLAGAYTRRDGKAAVAQTLEKVYAYFPRLKTRRASQAAYTSGGEQQMCAIGRALMCNPKMVLLDEPSMGLAPQIVEEVFEIVRDLNTKEGVTFLLAEQNTNMALRYADYGYILENGRIVMDGQAAALRANEDVKEFYLGVSRSTDGADRKSFRDVKSYKRRKRWLA